MRLIRFGTHGTEKPGVLLKDDTRVDVSSAFGDYDELFFANGGVEVLRKMAREERIDCTTSTVVSPAGSSRFPAQQDCVRRAQLPRARGRGSDGNTEGTGNLPVRLLRPSQAPTTPS